MRYLTVFIEWLNNFERRLNKFMRMSIALFLLFLLPISCDTDVLLGTFTKAEGNFVNTNYGNLHGIPVDSFSYRSSDSLEGHPISYAFDGRNSQTYWVSNDAIDETTTTYIIIDFYERKAIEGFVLGLSYRSPSERVFDGAPLELNVYG